MRGEFSTEELMTVAIARELRDDDVAFVGIGTGGRAFVLAVGIPTAACQLARLRHAPNLTLMLGPIINPDPLLQPESYTDSSLIGWRCEAQISGAECLDCFRLGVITVSFVSGAQVDKYGNLNVVAIGQQENPTVRLIGPVAQTDHLASPARNVIMNDLAKRTFVEKVDFISGAGYLQGRDARQQAGLPAQGPWLVVTDRALLDFDASTGHLSIKSRYPGVGPEEIRKRMGFEPFGLSDSREIEKPTSGELEVLRDVIDPKGILLNGGIDT